MERPAKYVIIVAGGKGSRMKSDLPKQFIEVAEKPILVHTIHQFQKAFSVIEIILVLHPQYLDYWKELAERFSLEMIQVIAGGESRFHSVQNGLSLVKNPHSIIGVHDAVRPFVPIATLQQLYQMAEEHEVVVPVIPLKDSIRQIEGNASKMVDRSQFRLVQTPQCFSYACLTQSYQQAYQAYFTDDASVAESAGFSISLAEGSVENIKITTPEDLEWCLFRLFKKSK